VLTGTSERVTEANQAFLDLVGYSRQDFLQHGLDWRKITPPEHAAQDAAALDALNKTGVCPLFEKEYIHKRGHRVPVVIGAALLDREPLRWIAFALDLSESKAREEHIRHLLQELTHRAKNLIAVIQAIAHQIIATSTSLKEFDERFSPRLHALAGIQDLLVQESWRGAPVRELVLSQLAHCTDLIHRRILIAGPPVSLTVTACQYIGMALHELCTNALKYGALSTETGTVSIRWSLRPSKRPEHFHMEWLESDGPSVHRRRGTVSAIGWSLGLPN
jgi:PAS domain S-box-containing protein